MVQSLNAALFHIDLAQVRDLAEVIRKQSKEVNLYFAQDFLS